MEEESRSQMHRYVPIERIAVVFFQFTDSGIERLRTVTNCARAAAERKGAVGKK